MDALSTTKVATQPEYLARWTPATGVSEPQVKILIVDDQPANLLALEAVLESLGHVIVKAASGEQALKCVLQNDFAVILLDVLMPGMDGFETASIIRERDRTRYTPIIFVTAVNMTDVHVSRGYAVGAIDYLFKPIVPEILKAKVAAFVDLYLKTATIAQQAEQLRLLERQKYQAELEKAQRELESQKIHQDALAARKVQQLLFPPTHPSFPGFEIAGACYPADATGGDFFDYIPGAEGTLDVVIGDVSGHGFPAALLMSATHAYLRALTLARADIDGLLKLVNRALSADTAGTHFVTLLYARLTSPRRRLIYTSAGHHDTFILNATGQIKTTLQSTSMPLGVVPDSDFPLGDEVELESGDVILLFTDGLIEAQAPDGTFFGAERALQVLRENLSRPAVDLVKLLRAAVEDFMQQSQLMDDITVILIKVV